MCKQKEFSQNVASKFLAQSNQEGEQNSLKSNSHLPKKNRFICFNESPLKMINNALNFILKAFFVLKIFKFLFWLFGYVKKRLDQKYKVNFNIYDVTIRLTNSCNTYIVQFSRSKENQTMKFGQII